MFLGPLGILDLALYLSVCILVNLRSMIGLWHHYSIILLLDKGSSSEDF